MLGFNSPGRVNSNRPNQFAGQSKVSLPGIIGKNVLLTPTKSMIAKTFSIRDRNKTLRSTFESLDNFHKHQQHDITVPNFAISSNSVFKDVPLTRQLFLEAYSKGKWNLSVVPRPDCFKEAHFLKAPVTYDENTRLKAVDSYMNLPHWKDSEFFQGKLNKICKTFKCAGASISLINGRHQVVKFQKSLNFKECPRNLSIDGHAILSNEFFILLDASKDWRTENNPLVKGVPFIKFYVAVPLVTKQGQIIGSLAAFDVYKRDDFSKQSINSLKATSQEIMELLNSYPTRVLLKETTASRNDLGRATSNAYSASSNLVFEKDGSGNAYSQNLHFRMNKSVLDSDFTSNLELWKSLASCGDSRVASSFLCRKIHETLHFNFVYVMEIRIVEPYKIPAELLPLENKFNSDNFPHMNSFVKNGQENIITRVLGSYGLNSDSLKFEPLIHYKLFVSEFGITYSSHENGIRFKSGVCMPIFKHGTNIVRRKPITPSHKVVPNTSVDIYLRTGGFLIACFNENVRPLLDTEVDGIVQSASVLRQIYLMS